MGRHAPPHVGGKTDRRIQSVLVFVFCEETQSHILIDNCAIALSFEIYRITQPGILTRTHRLHGDLSAAFAHSQL
jgi:hypothetical protein